MQSPILSACAFLLVGLSAESMAAAPGEPAPGAAIELKKLSLEDLMRVEVMDVSVSSVSRQASTVGESAAAITVITSDMIRRSGATTFPEILRMVPGMSVSRVDGNKWNVSARGLNSGIGGKMLVQVDGRTVYTPIFSIVYWDTVDYLLDDVDRIEVIRGPGGSVWGANAVNGIVNIITKSAKETKGVYLSGGGGSEERGFANFRFGGNIGENVHYRVYGKWFERDAQFRLFDDNHDQWRGARAGTRIDWTPTKEDTLTLQGDWFHSSAGRTTDSPLPQAEPPFAARDISDEVTNGGNVLARWTRTLDKESSVSVQAYWDRFDRQIGGLTGFVIDTYDLDLQHQFAWGDRQKLIYGAGYRYSDYFLASSEEDRFPVDNSPDSRDSHLVSAFVQDQIEIVPERFAMTVGSKFEHNDFTGFEIQPSGRVLWTPTKKQTAWLAVSRAVRTPGFVEDEVRVTTPSSPASPGVFPQLRGNYGLQSEVVIAYELGYRAQVADKLSIDVATFYNVYDDLVAFVSRPVDSDNTATYFPLVPSNRLEGETYGVELAVTWQPAKWWNLYGTYSYLQTSLHSKQEGLDASNNVLLSSQELGNEENSPQHQVYVRSSMDLPGNIELDVVGRYVDQVKAFAAGVAAPVAAGSARSYVTMDARVAWKPRDHLEIAVVGQNLLDEHHPETAALVPVEIQRGVYGTVTLRW